MLDAIDRALIACTCEDIGGLRYPYREIAAELGISEEEVLRRLHAYREQGIHRRFGAILRHQKAGFTANGMSVWNVPDEDAERVGGLLAACLEITHCYERPRFADWPYNLYAMIHAHTPDECRAVAERIACESGITDYQVLFSVREFKKTSMTYFATLGE